jgi:hypothetical protein
MLCRTCVFSSGGICGSHYAFRCVWVMKYRCTIFMLGWEQYGFDKKHTGTCYAELVFLHPVGFAFQCVRGVKHRHTIFHAWVGPVRISQKSHWDTLCQTFVFPCIWICGSRTAFRCIRVTKRRHTIFYAWLGPMQCVEKAHRDTLR